MNRTVVSEEMLQEVILLLEQNFSVKAACSKLGIGEHYRAVQSSLRSRGIFSSYSKKTAQKVKSLYLDKIIIGYCKDNKNLKQLGQEYNLSPSTIKHWLQEKGIKIRPMSEAKKRYTLNAHYFDQIDSCAKAYILGFIAADGYITDKNVIGITLKSSDKYILDFIKTQWECNNQIKTKVVRGHEYSSLQVVSLYMANRLKDLSIIPRKTYSLDPRVILSRSNIQPNSSLERAFLLGYFDGDGGIYHYVPSKKVKRTKGYSEMFSLSITGTYETCSFYQEKANMVGWIRQRYPERDTNNWTWGLGGRNRCKDFLTPLYEIKDEIGCFLSRKYELFILL